MYPLHTCWLTQGYSCHWHRECQHCNRTVSVYISIISQHSFHLVTIIHENLINIRMCVSNQIAILGARKPPRWNYLALLCRLQHSLLCYSLSRHVMYELPSKSATYAFPFNQTNFTTWTKILHNLCNAGIASYCIIYAVTDMSHSQTGTASNMRFNVILITWRTAMQ